MTKTVSSKKIVGFMRKKTPDTGGMSGAGL